MPRRSFLIVSASAVLAAGVSIGAVPAFALPGALDFASAATSSTSTTSPVDVAPADFDGDGVIDLAVADYPDRTVVVMLGNGDGTFDASIPVATGGSGPESIVAADLDGDGDRDVAVADIGGKVFMFAGDGAGGLGAPVTVAAGGTSSIELVAGDLDGDTDTDLAVANSGSRNVGVLLNDGTGAFDAATTYRVGFVSSRPVGIATGDLNGDDAPDLVAISASGPSGVVSVLLANGDGTFAVVANVGSGGNHPDAVQVGDVTGDGLADVVVANIALSGTVAVLSGDGTGHFSMLTTAATGGATPRGFAIGDLDGDGWNDLAVANGGSATVGLVQGDGSGGLLPPVTYPTAGTTPLTTVLADVDGDGRPDLVLPNATSGTVAVLLNRTADLPAPTTTTVLPAAGPSLWRAPVTFSAVVQGSGDTPPSGMVQFYVDGVAVGQEVTMAGGTATSEPVRGLAAGGHHVTAAYSGDSGHEPSASAAIEHAVVYGLSVLAPEFDSMVRPGSTLVVKVAVTDAFGAPIPDGLAQSLAKASPCGATISATGAQTLASVCLRYNAVSNRFTRSWHLGRTLGEIALTATISHAGTPATTSSTVAFTVGR